LSFLERIVGKILALQDEKRWIIIEKSEILAEI